VEFLSFFAECDTLNVHFKMAGSAQPLYGSCKVIRTDAVLQMGMLIIQRVILILFFVSVFVFDWRWGIVSVIPFFSWSVIFISDKKLPWLKDEREDFLYGMMPFWVMVFPFPFFMVLSKLYPAIDFFWGIALYCTIQLVFAGTDCMRSSIASRGYLVIAAVLRSWLVIMMPYVIIRQMDVISLLLGSTAVVPLWMTAWLGEGGITFFWGASDTRIRYVAQTVMAILLALAGMVVAQWLGVAWVSQFE
jgi:hypothetical protein